MRINRQHKPTTMRGSTPLDLNDVRKSLERQGWVSRPGKGSHALWYPPDRTKRAVSVPMNGKREARTKGRAMQNLRASLRQSGWVDPEVAHREPLPPRESAMTPTDTTDETGPTAQTAPPDPESTLMPSEMPNETQSTVVEEDWARSSTTGHVSSSIKEQLMSDDSVRFRCAHPRGGGCTFSSEKLTTVRAHSQIHRMPSLPTTRTPVAGLTAIKREARERTQEGKIAAAEQVRAALERAHRDGIVVREPALLPHGLGAGNLTKSVLLVATPAGSVVFECGNDACDYAAATFASVFAHRRSHSRAAASRPDHAAPSMNGHAQVTMPGTTVGDALARSVLRKEAADSASDDAAEEQSSAPADQSEVATPDAEQDVMPILRAAVAAAGPLGSAGGPFQEAVAYLREQLAVTVDHLRAIAASEYDHLEVAAEREQEMARLREQLEATRRQVISLRAEVDELRAERPALLDAQAQLGQLLGAFKKVGIGGTLAG
jgi:predicted RNA binding protein YcfA (HicA-like mRNA interferase family)